MKRLWGVFACRLERLASRVDEKLPMVWQTRLAILLTFVTLVIAALAANAAIEAGNRATEQGQLRAAVNCEILNRFLPGRDIDCIQLEGVDARKLQRARREVDALLRGR